MDTELSPRSVRHTERSVSPPALKRRKHVANTWPSTSNPGSIRVFSWNVNGVGPLLQTQLSFTPGSLSPLRSLLKRHDWPHLLCLQEVKISPKDAATQRRLEHAANQGHVGDEPTYTIHFSLPRDKHNATGFGGKVHGVASVIRNDFSVGLHLTRRPDWDLEGRLLIHEHASGLVIMNGYWVNGTSNPYRDPDTGKTIGTRHDHKLRFHQHVHEEVVRFESIGRLVVLIGDMNVAPARIDGQPHLRTSPVQHVTNRADFNSKFLADGNLKGMRGIDVFRHMHGDTKRFTYHPRGRPWGESCDRVDLIIVSRALMDAPNAVQDCDICDSPQERGHSDHVPLWITLDLDLLPVKMQVPRLSDD